MFSRNGFRKIVVILVVIIVVLIFIYILSLVSKNNQKETDSKVEEKSHAVLEESYDISSDGTIAYITYQSNSSPATLLVYNKDKPEKTASYKIKGDITNISFSESGNELYFATNDVVSEKQLQSTIYKIDILTRKKQEVFQDNSIIQDITIAIGGKEVIYTAASSYKDLGGFTGEVISDVDLYQYSPERKKKKQITHLKKNMMNSPILSSNDKSVFVAMDKSIYQVFLQDPSNIKKVLESPSGRTIYDFTLTSSDTKIIYQLPIEDKEPGPFEYELFQYNRKDKKTKQLTNLQEHSLNPMVVNGDTMYFMVNTRLGKGAPHFYLFKMNIESKNKDTKQVTLPSYEDFKKLTQKSK